VVHPRRRIAFAERTIELPGLGRYLLRVPQLPQLPSRRRDLTLDVAIAVAVTVIGELNVWRFDSVAGPRWLTTVSTLLLALPLLVRRSAPLLTCILVLLGVVAQSVVSSNSAEGFQMILAGGVAAYSVAAYSDRRRALVGLGLFVIGYAIYAGEDQNVRSGRTSDLWAGAFFGVGLLAAWLAGIFVHSSRERRAFARREAEHERTTTAAVAEERSRLARELHDIVSHNLSVVVAQAGGARAQGAGGSEPALEKIEQNSREALVEMRRLLGVLRATDDDVSLSPQPGIAQVTALAETVRAAGLPVQLDLDCDQTDIPPVLQLSVYRIVQEALTNALKHADAAQAHVRISRSATALTVEIADDGAGATASHDEDGGHGLVGMRERVDHFGGTLRAGPQPQGGFIVSAILPLTS
jgi:signal transduction histidine kinase